MPENNEGLAEAVRMRVAEENLTQAVITANGGPSSSTMTKVLTGKGSFRSAIFGQLDAGLGWAAGTAEAAWRGVAPSPIGFDWRSVTDRELLGEVERRMKGERTWEPGNSSSPEEADETHPRPTRDQVTLAATKGDYAEEGLEQGPGEGA